MYTHNYIMTYLHTYTHTYIRTYVRTYVYTQVISFRTGADFAKTCVTRDRRDRRTPETAASAAATAGVCEKTLLWKMIHTGILAFRAPDQGLDQV